MSSVFTGCTTQDAILYTGYSASRTWGGEQGELWTATLHFVECVKRYKEQGLYLRSYGWNHFYRSDYAVVNQSPWQLLYKAGTTETVYKQADFNLLFRVA